MLVGSRPRFLFPTALATLFFIGTVIYIAPPRLFSQEPIFDSVSRFGDHPTNVTPPASPPTSPEPPAHPPVDTPPKSTSQPHSFWNSRAEEVKEAFLHAYKGYKEFALPNDELKPLSREPANNFAGWGVTLIDALDTMWIMGLHDEFYDAVPIVANMTFALDERKFAPFFETVIRYLGGLLSAYALSNETIFLARADDLGRKLLPAFNTSSGLPMYAVNTVTGKLDAGWAPGSVLYSEALSCQMEYKYLAHLTGRAEYFEKTDKPLDVVADAPDVREGMFPTRWSLSMAKPINNVFSVGAFADSAHEYLLKQWLLSSKVETKAKDLYLRTVSSILDHLLYLSPTRHLLYVTDADTGMANRTSPSGVFEHLSCFLPGLLTLGAKTLPDTALTPAERQLHQWAAEGLGQTCWVLYADHITGLGPDEVLFRKDEFQFDERTPYLPSNGTLEYVELMMKEGVVKGRWMEHVKLWEGAGRPGGVPPGVKDPEPALPRGSRDYVIRKSAYFLRPETIETFYLLYRTTGDIKWRERGWAVFQAIQKETRTADGYASIQTVDQSPSVKLDEMPSFFMAETLKYLYLLFSEDDHIPLDKWVFNTEAHPLPIFEWSRWEKARYKLQ